MSKNLEEKFRSFCDSKNLEINQNQITTIKLLQDFYNKNFHFSIFNIFKKENSFKGKIGIFDVKNNKINHRLNFYKIDEGEIKEIF